MNKRKLLIVFAIVALIAINVLHFAPKLNTNAISQNPGNQNYQGASGTSSYLQSSSPTPITYSNLAYVLSRNSMIQALPESSVILLKFYNFNSGERQWEKSYILTKGSVREGTANADLIILLHSKYLAELSENNLCNIIQKAKANGDFGTEMQLSTASFMWRYKSMMGYKSCFGF